MLTLSPSMFQAHVLWELSQCIASAVNADGFNMSIADPSNQILTHYIEKR